MSHHTRSFKSTLFAQAMVLTPWVMFTTKSQAMIDKVGTLRALQWPGRGIKTSKAQMKDATDMPIDMTGRGTGRKTQGEGE